MKQLKVVKIDGEFFAVQAGNEYVDIDFLEKPDRLDTWFTASCIRKYCLLDSQHEAQVLLDKVIASGLHTDLLVEDV